LYAIGSDRLGDVYCAKADEGVRKCRDSEFHYMLSFISGVLRFDV
jgi:hypothetical protein